MNNNLSEDRVLYEDDNVCILNPKLKEGIIVWTNFTQPEGMESLCIAGLKSGKQLHDNGLAFGRSVFHPFIFFRAPYYNPDTIDYSSIETEIESLYGKLPNPQTDSGRAFIRVDPDKTYIFSSEIRAKYKPDWSIKYGTAKYWESIEQEIKRSRKSLTEYLRIIKDNESVVSEAEHPVYHLYSSRKLPYNIKYPKYPQNLQPINRNSEILVKKPHLESYYFVKCD